MGACSSEVPEEALNQDPNPVPLVGLAELQEGSPTTGPTRPLNPACRPEVKEGQLWVGERDLGIEAPKAEDVVTFPLDRERILVSIKSDWRHPELALGKGTLWVVNCEPPHEVTVFYQRLGADFGHGAISPDGQSLIFTSAQGIESLFLENKLVHTVTQVPAVADTCWTHGEGAFPQSMRDLVLGVDRAKGHVILERGAFCGLGSTWIGRIWHLKELMAPEDVPMRSPRPIVTVQADADGILWVGDGGRCNQPGVQDLHTPGHVFQSDDGGDRWEKVRVRVGVGVMHTAAQAIVVDMRRSGHLMVHSARCTSPLGTYGGRLFITRDGGTTWKRVSIPAHVGDSTDGGQGVAGVALIGGSVDRFRIWNDAGECFQSMNTGSTWSKVSAKSKKPSPPTRVTLDGVSYGATEDGLERQVSGEEAERLFPMRIILGEEPRQ
jgi:hypothetical protein